MNVIWTEVDGGEVRREMFMELGIQSGLVELRRGTLTSSNV